MNIAFFGSSLVSAYWNGAATYYRGIIRALWERGHRVTFYEPDAYQRHDHRDMADPPWAEVVVYDIDDGRGPVDHTLQRASRADVVVKASGVGAFDDYLERAVLDLKSADTRVVFWDVDAPATLEAVADDPAGPFGQLVGEYDAILTYGGGQRVVDGYEAIGAKRCVPVYNAVDPQTHHPADPDPAFAADLAFLGNRLPDREQRFEEFFVRPAAAAPARQFVLGGSGWDAQALPDNIAYVGHVYTGEHNAFNCSARAVINISRDSMARYGFSPATRVFEAAGAGACIVTDAWEGIEVFLQPDREVLVADDGADVTRLVDKLDDGRAAQIGGAARRRVLSEHTYAHRAEQVEDVLTEQISPSLPRAQNL